MFQFGGTAGTGRHNPVNYLELSDQGSSSVPYDPEVETEFSRLLNENNVTGLFDYQGKRGQKNRRMSEYDLKES